ncbi:MAG: ABC transporter substrate-binding protein [Gammaproteobacteria bacterium]
MPLACLLCIALHFVSCVSPSVQAKELILLSWVGHMDASVIQAFEARHDVELRFEYVDSPDDRAQMLLRSRGSGYDLAQVGATALPAYVGAGWLAPLGEHTIPNRRHIGNGWTEALGDAAGYCIPFLWGAIGILYREDLLEQPPGSWREFLTPRDAWSGKVMMTRGARELLAMALLAGGHSINSTDPAEIKAAGELLIAHRPMVVHDYRYTVLDGSARILRGEALAAFSWSGNPRLLMKRHDALRFIYPSDGTALWMDAWCVLAKSQDKSLAQDFIDYVNEPAIAARVAVSLTAATTNTAALEHVPEAYRDDPVVWPPEEVIEDAEFLKSMPPRALRYYNQIRTTLLR